MPTNSVHLTYTIQTTTEQMDYAFYQEYWWLLVSILGALLVFLLFVQGGQSLFFRVGKVPLERARLVNSVGRKW